MRQSLIANMDIAPSGTPSASVSDGGGSNSGNNASNSGQEKSAGTIPPATAPSAGAGVSRTNSVASIASSSSTNPRMSQPADVGADRPSTTESVATAKTAAGGDKNEDMANEIIKSLFGDVGELISDFSCAIESNILLHGRMYITSRFICFYSNLFGLEKKIRIPYQHIKLITKENTAVVIPNAIAITTHQKEYIFRSFWDRDECYGIITNMLAKSRNAPKADRDKEKEKFDTERLSHIVHSAEASSAPSSIPFANSSSSSSSSALPQTRPVSMSVVQDRSPAPGLLAEAAAAGPGNEGINNNANRAMDKSRRRTISLSSSPVPSAATADNETDLVMGRKELDSAMGADTTPAAPSVDIAALVAEMNAEIESSKLKLPVASEKFGISVDAFEKLFVGEDAPEGYIVYHRMMKDENIQVTPWSGESTSLGHAREIRFLKPVNLPGLVSTRAKKLQRFRRFGDEGLIVCSSTHLEDVPAADTFSVEDMIAVVSLGPNEVQVSLTFEVKFVKSTMFRRIIESSTNTEMMKWLVDFFAYLKKCAESNSNYVGKTNSGEINSSSKKKADKIKEIKPDTSLHVKPPEIPPLPTSLLDQIRHELSCINFVDYIVFWVAWGALMLSLLFFGMQWKSVSDQIYYSNIEIQKALDLCQKVTEENSRLVALLEQRNSGQ